MIIFDYDDGDYIFRTSDSIGMDSKGQMHIRMGGNMFLDMESGELHICSNCEEEE